MAVQVIRAADGQRRALVVARWRSLVIAAVVAASIVLLALVGLRVPLAKIVTAPLCMPAVASLVLTAILLHEARGRWLAFTGLKHVSTYPPVWIAGLGGASGIGLVLARVPNVREAIGIQTEDAFLFARLGIVGAAAFFGVILASVGQMSWRAYAHRNAARRQTQQEGAATFVVKALHGSFEELESWLTDDAPIVRDEDDAFGHSRIARRIASRLLEQRPPAQAIVGKLGAGKTTLRALVVGSLKRMSAAADHVHVVPVELWPYETPRAAVEGVIRALVDALSAEVNVTALRGLPESYVRAMSSVGGVWSAIAHLQGSTGSPFEALRRIDDVATAIGHRYVVWVEDLERFAGHGGSFDAETPEDAERLNPIRALLYGLDKLQSVTVITATTSLHVRFDLEKIARFVEELPELPEHEVAKIIATFRQGCRERFDVIDPAESSVRSVLDKLGQHERLEIRRAILGTGIHSLQDALPALCSTPRALKQALRSAFDTWTRLAGEIDVDDLIAMSILREAEPELFALVRQHVDALRGVGVARDDKRNARQAWDTAFAKMPLDDRTRRAISEVIKFVFSDQHAEIKPQGFVNMRHTDYWERFLAVPTLTEAEQDQNVLRVLIDDDDDALLQLLEDSERSDAVESFSRLLSTNRLRRLFVPLIKRRVGENPSAWSDGHPPGMVPLWRMWLRRSERGELKPADVLEEVRQALDVAVPASLYLAVHLEEYFVTAGDAYDMLRDGHVSRAEEVKTYLRDLVVATFSGKADALADALVGARIPTLLWVCWGIDRVRARTMTGEPFPSWPALAATILEAARRRPIELIPQVACLVTRESMVFARHGQLAQKYEFDVAAAANLFGSVDAVFDVFEPHDAARWAGMGPVEAVFLGVRERREQRRQAS